MVLLKGAARTPAEVWTGSTNISMGGIHGQTNVGHWVRDRAVAERVRGLLGAARARTPGATATTRVDGQQEERGLQEGGRGAAPVPTTLAGIPPGTTADLQPARGQRGARPVLQAGRRGREARVHHPGLRHQQGLQERSSRTTPRTSHRVLPAAREEGQAEPKSTKNTFVFVEREQQHLQGLGLVPAGAGATSGRKETNARACSGSTSTSATSTPSSCCAIRSARTRSWSPARRTSATPPPTTTTRTCSRSAATGASPTSTSPSSTACSTTTTSARWWSRCGTDASVNRTRACSWPRTTVAAEVQAGIAAGQARGDVQGDGGRLRRPLTERPLTLPSPPGRGRGYWAVRSRRGREARRCPSAL